MIYEEMMNTVNKCCYNTLLYIIIPAEREEERLLHRFITITLWLILTLSVHTWCWCLAQSHWKHRKIPPLFDLHLDLCIKPKHFKERCLYYRIKKAFHFRKRITGLVLAFAIKWIKPYKSCNCHHLKTHGTGVSSR